MSRYILEKNSRLRIDDVFEGLSASARERLMASAVTRLYKKGEVVFKEDTVPSGIYCITSGMVKKFTETQQGREQIFFVCGEGELMGYHALLGGDRYPYSASTLAESQIIFLPKDDFFQILVSSPRLSNVMLKALGHEFSIFINLITTLATKSVRERLAFNLLLLEEKFQNNGHAGMITLSRTDLAYLVGTAKENVVRVLQDFAEIGMISKTNKSIQISNRKRLMKEAKL